MRWLSLLALAAGCSTTEPLDLPANAAEHGVPVGVQTLDADGEVVEVWYPAAGDAPGTDEIALETWVSDAFLDRVGDTVNIPTWTQAALRDAPARALEAPVPVVLFSHGFGGFRAQSAELTAHLASRGYVVVAADHPGRMLSDVIPCLVTPAAGDCDLGGFGGGGGGEDPAQEDLTTVLGWLDDNGLPEDVAAIADMDRLGIFGHSAGGGSTARFASTEARIDAALPMAGTSDFTRELPSLIVGGSCDAIVPESALVDAGPTASEGYVSLDGAGHLAFSDLCLADLGGVADQIGERDDANDLILSGLRALATDGCPDAVPTLEGCGDAFLDLDTSGRILRHTTTVFFDQHLVGTGGGLDPDDFDDLVSLAP